MKLIVICILLFTIPIALFSQEESTFRILFWNVENLFDPEDDSLKNDGEFTPEGTRHWTKSRMYSKINKTAKVILATGNPEPPVVVGLCEIENENVVRKLITYSPLRNFNYDLVHQESPDRRGIDVALIYRKEFFLPLFSRAIPIHFPFDTAGRTRDILYVKGLLNNQDTVHLFVNHWPSRYGGYMATKPKREYVASCLRAVCDSIFSSNPKANIIIGGDFNDDPTDESLSVCLNALPEKPDNKNSDYLVNLMSIVKERGEGTLKHGAEWNVFDMLIVSGNLLKNEDSGMKILNEKASVFKADFLFETDERNLGKKLNRTYIGFKYHGGFSDHLPVYLDLYIK